MVEGSGVDLIRMSDGDIGGNSVRLRVLGRQTGRGRLRTTTTSTPRSSSRVASPTGALRYVCHPRTWTTGLRPWTSSRQAEASAGCAVSRFAWRSTASSRCPFPSSRWTTPSRSPRSKSGWTWAAAGSMTCASSTSRCGRPGQTRRSHRRGQGTSGSERASRCQQIREQPQAEQGFTDVIADLPAGPQAAQPVQMGRLAAQPSVAFQPHAASPATSLSATAWCSAPGALLGFARSFGGAGVSVGCDSFAGGAPAGAVATFRAAALCDEHVLAAG